MEKRGPLDGIIVLDLTRFLAGPYCTGLLYNLGARVIKIENPNGGDDSRQFPPFYEGESVYSCALNHGKESIALDIKDNPEDKKIFEKLICRADVLVENFRPGVLARLGYEQNVLKKLNPQLIVSHISGYGKSGPESLRACYDLVAQGISGLISMTGEEGGRPVKAGIELADICAGVFVAVGICASLFDRTRTGHGISLGASLIDSLVGMFYGPFSRYSTTGEIPKPTGARHALTAPFDIFQAQDKPFVICAASNRLFAMLCQGIGKPEWITDPRFIKNADRIKHVEELEKLMNEVLQTKTAEEWLAIFNQAGVPAGPINSIPEVLEEPQIQHRKMIAHFADGYMPSARFPGNPIKFSDYQDTNEYPRGPKLNEHRDAILQWLKEDHNL